MHFASPLQTSWHCSSISWPPKWPQIRSGKEYKNNSENPSTKGSGCDGIWILWQLSEQSTSTGEKMASVKATGSTLLWLLITWFSQPFVYVKNWCEESVAFLLITLGGLLRNRGWNWEEDIPTKSPFHKMTSVFMCVFIQVKALIITRVIFPLG